MSSYPHTDDPLVQALQLLLEREGGHIKVGDETGVSDQSLYQIANCKPDAKTGKPKSVGPSIRKRLSERYGDWLSSTAQPAPPDITLEAALPVVLGRLPGLTDYRAGQVRNAIDAATKPGADLEQIERDLLQWLSEPRTTQGQAGAGADPSRKEQRAA